MIRPLRRLARKFLLTIRPGHERWDVKVGTDALATTVAPATVRATVAQLSAFAAPARPTTRVYPFETTIYSVSATLSMAHLEADGDYHCVLHGATGDTMIAEIPDPAFVGTSSPWKQQINRARYDFERLFGNIQDQPTLIGRPVTVTGVGFFDRAHSQTGAAPNQIELHPVLSITSP